MSIAHDEVEKHFVDNTTVLCDVCDTEIKGQVRWHEDSMVCKPCYKALRTSPTPVMRTIKYGATMIAVGLVGVGVFDYMALPWMHSIDVIGTIVAEVALFANYYRGLTNS